MNYYNTKDGVTSITCLGSQQASEMSILPLFSRQLIHRWQWGCQFCTQASRPLATRRFLVFISSESQDHSVAWRIRSIEKPSYLIGDWNRDIPLCSILPKTTKLQRARKLRSQDFASKHGRKQNVMPQSWKSAVFSPFCSRTTRCNSLQLCTLIVVGV
jgi:hypothetical protein